MKFDKRIIGVAEVASTENYREALKCIRFEDGKAIATDGYMLLIIEDPQNIKDEDIPDVAGYKYKPLKNIHLPAKQLAQIIKGKKKNRLPVLNLAWTIRKKEDLVMVAYTDLDTAYMQELRQPETEYPNYKKILKQAMDKQPVIEVSFDARRMVKLLEAMIKAGVSKYSKTTLRLTEGKHEPLILTAEDAEKRQVTALLMPMS